MRGDKHKPQSRFTRWVDCFYDGMFRRTEKGKKRIPSGVQYVLSPTRDAPKIIVLEVLAK